MCKYCKMEELNKGEFSNGNQSIIRIKDGSQVIEANLNRYQCDGHRDNHLILDTLVVINNELIPVKSKRIKIKYCPFCGEEL